MGTNSRHMGKPIQSPPIFMPRLNRPASSGCAARMARPPMKDPTVGDADMLREPISSATEDRRARKRSRWWSSDRRSGLGIFVDARSLEKAGRMSMIESKTPVPYRDDR
ncbi:major facilitator superfamily transporter [Colletotrichum asianum]